MVWKGNVGVRTTRVSLRWNRCWQPAGWQRYWQVRPSLQAATAATHLDDALAAGAQHGAQGAEVGLQVLVPHRLDHLTRHNLRGWRGR